MFSSSNVLLTVIAAGVLVTGQFASAQDNIQYNPQAAGFQVDSRLLVPVVYEMKEDKRLEITRAVDGVRLGSIARFGYSLSIGPTAGAGLFIGKAGPKKSLEEYGRSVQGLILMGDIGNNGAMISIGLDQEVDLGNGKMTRGDGFVNEYSYGSISVVMAQINGSQNRNGRYLGPSLSLPLLGEFDTTIAGLRRIGASSPQATKWIFEVGARLRFRGIEW